MKMDSDEHPACGFLGAQAVGLRFAENLSQCAVLPKNKELRSARLHIRVAHEYARQLHFNLNFYFIRCI